MKCPYHIALALTALVALTSGCSNKLVFATHTSFGLDVSGTAEVPNRVSFSYNRQEAAIVPRKSNGEAHAVFGGLDSDINFFDGSIIKQNFATGDAAKIATGSDSDPLGTTTKTKADPLVFFTGTTFGLHLSAGDGQVQPSILMGYRRAEAAYIPVPDPGQEVRSVYADVLINTKTPDATNKQTDITEKFPTQKNGVRIKQSFATGKAAINLAHDKGIQDKLNQAAGTAVGALERLKTRAATLRQNITIEVSRLKEGQLSSGGDAMKTSGLVDDANLQEFLKMDSFEKSRTLRACLRSHEC